MSCPSVSFVVTFYNKERFVPVVLQSIRAQQELGEVEYIFVDDGSTDNTLKVLREHTKDWQNCTIISQTNAGQTAATNAGLACAKHAFIKTWDGDDYAHPLITRRCIDACEQLGVDLAYCATPIGPMTNPDNWNEINTFLQTIQPTDAIKIERSDRRLLRNHISNPTGTLFRRRLLEQVGLNDTRIKICDVYFTYVATCFTDFAWLGQPLSFAFPIINNNNARQITNQAQIRHDINGAAACFYQNFYQHINFSTRYFMARKAASRAWMWARRELKQGWDSRYFWRYVRALIPWPLSFAAMFQTCEPFRLPPAKVRVDQGIIDSMQFPEKYSRPVYHRSA